MKSGLLNTLTLLAMLAASAHANATEPAPDEELRALKQELVALNRDLFMLEEELLFPASTQVAVYLSMDVGKYFALDAVELSIGKERVAKYLYTEREVDALHRGGVHRLYLGLDGPPAAGLDDVRRAGGFVVASQVALGHAGRIGDGSRKGDALQGEGRLDAGLLLAIAAHVPDAAQQAAQVVAAHAAVEEVDLVQDDRLQPGQQLRLPG